jgi:uncharacterized repeat protein (TIGR03803 family)
MCAVTASTSDAQVFNTIVNFDGGNGAAPLHVSLAQGTDGNLYGTTTAGGSSNLGTIFRMTPEGVVAVIHSFCSSSGCSDGSQPYSGLTLSTDGNFYGTTITGGRNNLGTVYRVTPTGTVKTLHQFNQTDGAYPWGGLVQGRDGDFYGTTSAGGSKNSGTIFRITPGGAFTTVHDFCSLPSCGDGVSPYAALIQATDGNLYGIAIPYVYKMTPAGVFTTLASLSGGLSYGPLYQAADGNFYGTTYTGGDVNKGTVFKMTPAGSMTTVYNFCGQPSCPDGEYPVVGVIQGTDGSLYGATIYGGANVTACNGVGCGTIFKITPSGMFTRLYSFCSQPNCSDGEAAYGGLHQATNGVFYGSTDVAGGGDEGTVYSLSTGCGPFVTFVRNSAYVGQTRPILGQGFTGTTGVSINGTSVGFTVASDTLIQATISAGATTGRVTVNAPGGTLISNVLFRVLPQLLDFSPPSGPVGTLVTITGVSLTQTTHVGFNNQTPAQFTLNSDTQLTATVPSGAQTGPIRIQTQGGTAISQQTFTVTQ